MLTAQCIVIAVTVLISFTNAAVPYGRSRTRAAPVAYATVPTAPSRRYVAAASPTRYVTNAAADTGAYVAGPEENYQPQPHNFNYDVTDEYGNQRYHQESGDGSGRVTGSYGYRDAYGVFRYVDYVADADGFRATIRSNEPGMDNPAPAGVQYSLEQPPATVYLGSQQNAPASSTRNY